MGQKRFLILLLFGCFAFVFNNFAVHGTCGDSIFANPAKSSSFAEKSKLQVFILKAIPTEYQGNYLIVKAEFDGTPKTKIIRLSSDIEDGESLAWEKLTLGKDKPIALVKPVNDYNQWFYGTIVFDSDNNPPEYVAFNMRTGFVYPNKAESGLIYKLTDESSDTPCKKPTMNNINNVVKFLENRIKRK